MSTALGMPKPECEKTAHLIGELGVDHGFGVFVRGFVSFRPQPQQGQQSGDTGHEHGIGDDGQGYAGKWDANDGDTEDVCVGELPRPRFKFLALVVTRRAETGEVVDQRTWRFYVPANGTATFTVWNNDYRLVDGVGEGVTRVAVEVTHIDTYTVDWRPLSIDVDGPIVTVDVPTTP